ncbi:MAG: CpaF family protein [Alphaproteobacteria bacterium]
MTPPDTQAKRKDAGSTASSGGTPAAGGFGKRQAMPAQHKPHLVTVAPAPTSAPVQKNDIKAEPAPAPMQELHPLLPEYETLSPHLENAMEFFRKTVKQMIDARSLSRMKRDAATIEIQMTIDEIAAHHKEQYNLTPPELKQLGKLIADEMLGLGPLEQLLARDEISEIMVNGPNTVYIEINGIVDKSPVTFRDSEQLVSVCQRIANSVGRRVDESGPICDARLPDGSRVNIILPPLAIDGAALTIRKFKRDKLTLDKLIEYGSISEMGAELIKIIAACRVNTIVSGGTGSGKTTMLNCLTRYISSRERIVTCEDSAELQLQQPHVVRLETRTANLEGVGEVSMRDLVKNCLRMRPERIIVGEVRGPEAFDLLQAMNTGHDGSMGTVHANSPRDAISRLESMIAMNRLNIAAETIRAQIASSINCIVQVQRLRDGTRKVVSISELTGMEGEVVSMQDLLTYVITGEDARGRLIGEFRPSGLRPRFYEKLREFGLESRFDTLMETYCMTSD